MKQSVGLVLSVVAFGLAAFFSVVQNRCAGFRRSFRRVSTCDCQHAAFLYVFNAIDQRLLCRPGHLAILIVIGILRLRSGDRYSILIIGGGCADGSQPTGPTIIGRSAAALPDETGYTPTQPGIAPAPSPSGSVPAKQPTPSRPSPANRTVYPRRKRTPKDYPARAWTRSS